MPQTRTLLHDGKALAVERVVLGLAAGRWSATYEVASRRIVLPVQGVLEFRLAEATSVVVDSITALSLPTGLPYRMNPAAGQVPESIVLREQPGAVSSLPGRAGQWILPPRTIWELRLRWRGMARGALADLSTLSRHADAEPAGDAETVRVAVSGQAALAAASPRASAAVVRARRFMALRIAALDGARWNLHDVADAACCSPFHLARLFRRHTGVSLHGYRQRLRMATALQQLEQGERDLAGLSAALGYASQSHMGTEFQSELRLTPAQARHQLAA